MRAAGFYYFLKAKIIISLKSIGQQKNKLLEDSNQKTRQLLKQHEKDINFEMTVRCYDHCVKSFMEKILSPYEKECFTHCYQNLTSFYIEVHNSLIPASSQSKTGNI